MGHRLAKILPLLDRVKADALLITSLTNIRYFCGFSGSSAQLLVSRRGSFLFTDGRYRIQAQQEVAGAEVIVCKKMADALKSTLLDLSAKTVAFEAKHLTYHQWQRLEEKITGGALLPLQDEIDTLRIQKDDHELASIRKGADLAKEAFFAVRELIRPGTREVDVAIALESALRRLGGEKVSFDIIVASGKRSALPHAVPTEKEIDEGDLVVVDFGVVINGYHTDETCTLKVGDVTPEAEKIHDIVSQAQRLAIEAVKPGVTAKNIDAAARDHIRQCGYGDYFGHGTGHGVGLEVHELPVINEEGAAVLTEGMVFTVEPGIYLPETGGVRIEDMVLVTGTGSEIITKCNVNLRG